MSWAPFNLSGPESYSGAVKVALHLWSRLVHWVGVVGRLVLLDETLGIELSNVSLLLSNRRKA